MMRAPKYTVEDVPLVGGAICLDFVNTIHDRRKEPSYDYFESYHDFLAWSHRCGTLRSAEVKTLAAMARERPRLAQAALRKAQSIREVLFHVFAAVAQHDRAGPDQLRTLNAVANDTYSVLQLHMTSDNAVWLLPEAHLDLNDPLRLIIHSAVGLMTDRAFQRIKLCDACGWIFLDQSKNGSRRWCSMKTCGSIDKALRYYYRKKQKGPKRRG